MLMQMARRAGCGGPDRKTALEPVAWGMLVVSAAMLVVMLMLAGSAAAGEQELQASQRKLRMLHSAMRERTGVTLETSTCEWHHRGTFCVRVILRWEDVAFA